MLSLSEAAKVAGQSKSTIWRAVKSGRVSATRADGGDYQIDPAELHRVFPIVGTGQGRDTAASVKQDATALERAETAALQAQIDSLRQIGELLRTELDDVRKDRDAWRSQADKLLLTHSTPAEPAKPTGWLRRMVG